MPSLPSLDERSTVFLVEVELVEAEVEVEVGLEAEADLADWLLPEVEEDWEEAPDGF